MQMGHLAGDHTSNSTSLKFSGRSSLILQLKPHLMVAWSTVLEGGVVSAPHPDSAYHCLIVVLA